MDSFLGMLVSFPFHFAFLSRNCSRHCVLVCAFEFECKSAAEGIWHKSPLWKSVFFSSAVRERYIYGDHLQMTDVVGSCRISSYSFTISFLLFIKDDEFHISPLVRAFFISSFTLADGLCSLCCVHRGWCPTIAAAISSTMHAGVEWQVIRKPRE